MAGKHSADNINKNKKDLEEDKENVFSDILNNRQQYTTFTRPVTTADLQENEDDEEEDEKEETKPQTVVTPQVNDEQKEKPSYMEENTYDPYKYAVNVKNEDDFVEDDEDYDDENPTKPAVKILIIVLAIIAVIAVIAVICNVVSKVKGNKEDSTAEETTQEESVTEIAGEKVLGKLKIPTINVETYIADSTVDKVLNEAAGRIDNGTYMNEVGNFVIAGHNNYEMFGKLSELSNGNDIILEDLNGNQTYYVITKIYQVEPSDLECLLNDEESTVVTLVTCDSIGTQRLIVRAEKYKVVKASESNGTTDSTNTTNTTNTVK